MEDFQVSKYFRFYELTDSASHPELVEKNRQEALSYRNNMQDVAQKIGDALREKFGVLICPSCFRGPELNGAVYKDMGGSPNLHSQHLYGMAMDLKREDDNSLHGLLEMSQWLKASGILFGQGLIEGGDRLHVSLPGATHFREVNLAEYVNAKWQMRVAA